MPKNILQIHWSVSQTQMTFSKPEMSLANPENPRAKTWITEDLVEQTRTGKQKRTAFMVCSFIFELFLTFRRKYDRKNEPPDP